MDREWSDPWRVPVSVTWDAYTNRAQDAPYTVLDGTTSFELGTVTVDQRQAPADFVEDGVLSTYEIETKA